MTHPPKSHFQFSFIRANPLNQCEFPAIISMAIRLLGRIDVS